jgi:hypothetical protein
MDRSVSAVAAPALTEPPDTEGVLPNVTSSPLAANTASSTRLSAPAAADEEYTRSELNSVACASAAPKRASAAVSAVSAHAARLRLGVMACRVAVLQNEEAGRGRRGGGGGLVQALWVSVQVVTAPHDAPAGLAETATMPRVPPSHGATVECTWGARIR